MSLAEANNYLAVHLHKILSQEEKNVFFSPFSISVAMGMLLCGAAGETASELKVALGYEYAGIKKENIASLFQQEMSLLLQHNDSYTLSFANSMLSQIGFRVKDEYKQIISNSFKSLMLEVDFNGDNENVINKINEWVEEKTNKKIQNFVKSLHPQTVLVLLNAVYFKGTWKDKFDEEGTKPKTFYNNGMENKTKQVQMMHMTGSFPFYQEKNYEALQLPYVGEEVAILVLLPRERNGLDALEATLLPSFIQDIKKNLHNRTMKIRIPRFRLEYEKKLIPSFQELGVNRVFTNAELTHLSEEWYLAVSEILHKAVLEMKEEGSEAVATTMIVGKGIPRSAVRPKPIPIFYADHPFLLVIYNTKSDLILFMGRVNEL